MGRKSPIRKFVTEKKRKSFACREREREREIAIAQDDLKIGNLK